MRITCQIEDVDEKLAEIIESLDFLDEFEVESDEESMIVANNYKVLIPSLGLYAREGSMLCYSESEQGWYADFSLTIIYNMEDEQLYWEQDDIAITLHNFLHAINKTVESVYGLECIIEIGEDKAEEQS